MYYPQNIDYTPYYRKYLDKKIHDRGRRWELMDCLAAKWLEADTDESLREFYYKRGLTEKGILSPAGFAYDGAGYDHGRSKDFILRDLTDADFKLFCTQVGIDHKTALAYRKEYRHE